MRDFDTAFSEYKSMTEARLEELLPEDGSELEVYKAMRYSLLSGGKRVRAALCLASCEACGGRAGEALDAACALEMVHTYSLIHDDLPCMDDDDMRRGRPSCHKAFGEATALLAGDALLTFAFRTLSGLPNAGECVKLLSEASGFGGMIGGQELDLLFEEQGASSEELDSMHALKTGALIRAAAALGAACAKADEVRKKALEEYALAVGLAFQITDDVLDAVSTDEELGKPTGSDERGGKTTYFSLCGEGQSLERAKALTEKALAAYKTAFGDEGFLPSLALNLLKRTN
ncbi:MAG: polyprenyl synthetase family protein [Oscillospiraceae bacterium]|nr:polyprenyl synthetase family protein [Oscillospiraceae bacterium]